MCYHKLLKSINTTEIKTKNLNMIMILEWDKMTLIIRPLKISLIFLSMTTKVWIKWRKLSILELSCNIVESLLMMIKFYLPLTKKEHVFSFINLEPVFLVTGKDDKLCSMLMFTFTKRMLYRLRQLSTFHTKLSRLRRNKSIISKSMMTTRETHKEKDVLWKKKRRKAILKMLINHTTQTVDSATLCLVKLISKQQW